MRLMQLIKTVLDDLYNKIDIENEQEKDAKIKNEIGNLTMEYKLLTDRTKPCLDYRDPIRRFAYIYKYTVAHADYIMQIIRDHPGLSNLFSEDSVDVACLGGGPGSDFLGILKYMIAEESNSSLTCYIFDKERAWGDSWSRVAKRAQAPFRTFPIFQQMDVTQQDTWESYNDYLDADLFTLSYFVSEVWRFRSEAEPFFDHCLSKAKPGSHVLFIDNYASPFYGWFDEMVARQGFQTIAGGRETFAFSNEEEKRDLGIFFDKFDWPKRKGDAAYRVLRKGTK
jgi:SAM-dependent methyltransferase